MNYRSKNGYTLHYEIVGNGIPLVFLHGLGGSIKQIQNTYININGIQLILIDQQGHGQSSSIIDFISFDNMANDIFDILDSINIQYFFLAGISMGAAVSLKMACLQPNRVKKLVLIRNAWINKPMKKRFITLYDLTANYLQKRDLEGFLKDPLFLEIKNESKQASDSLINYFYDEASLKYYEKYHILPKTSPFNSLIELDSIICPTLILANHYDPIHLFEYSVLLKNTIQKSYFKEITSKDINKYKHKKELNLELFHFLSYN